MKETKKQLIEDIEKLLNSYEGGSVTHIKQTLKGIIDSLLRQKEKTVESNMEWLEQFKKY